MRELAEFVTYMSDFEVNADIFLLVALMRLSIIRWCKKQLSLRPLTHYSEFLIL